jgi:hypothetical protein
VYLSQVKIKPVVIAVAETVVMALRAQKSQNAHYDRFSLYSDTWIPVNKPNLLLGRTYRSMHYNKKSMNIHLMC